MIQNLQAFLQGKELKPVDIGKSGAQVYFVGTDFVWKYADRADIVETEVWDSCVREIQLYRVFQEKETDFAPETVYIGQTARETSLLLLRGEMLDRDYISPQMIGRIMDLLVRIHHFPPPDFLETPGAYIPMDETQWNACLQGWKSVLSEHPGVFDEKDVEFVEKNLDDVNLAVCSRPQGFVHGDFHWDNLLQMLDGQLLACDWQSTGIGDPASDLSFLYSRLSADGREIGEETLIYAYCDAAARAGYVEDARAIARAIALADVNTAFAFWHIYLHDTPEARVSGVFNKMVQNMHRLLEI